MIPTCQHRGLTLLEVLAATVLMGALAAAVVPLLQDAARAAALEPPPFDLSELAMAADALMREADLAALSAESEINLELPWIDHPERTPIRVVELAEPDSPPGAGSIDHTWLVFECGPWRIVRWLKLAKTEAESSP